MTLKKNFLSILAGASFLAGSLVSPLESRGDVLYITNQANTPNIQNGTEYFRHMTGASEGYDVQDATNWPPETYPQKVRIQSTVDGQILSSNTKDTSSETKFQSDLIAIDPLGTKVTTSGTNSLYFSFNANGPDTNRIYVIKVHLDGQYTEDGLDMDYVGNIREIYQNGRKLNMKNIKDVPDQTKYGSVEISCKFLKDPQISNFSSNGTNVNLETSVQSGSYVQDTIESKTSLTNSTWNPEKINSLEYITPTGSNFDSIEKRIYSLPINSETSKFYRIKRQESTN